MSDRYSYTCSRGFWIVVETVIGSMRANLIRAGDRGALTDGPTAAPLRPGSNPARACPRPGRTGIELGPWAQSEVEGMGTASDWDLTPPERVNGGSRAQ